jgi:hypothetical protein
MAHSASSWLQTQYTDLSLLMIFKGMDEFFTYERAESSELKGKTVIHLTFPVASASSIIGMVKPPMVNELKSL